MRRYLYFRGFPLDFVFSLSKKEAAWQNYPVYDRFRERRGPILPKGVKHNQPGAADQDTNRHPSAFYAPKAPQTKRRQNIVRIGMTVNLTSRTGTHVKKDGGKCYQKAARDKGPPLDFIGFHTGYTGAGGPAQNRETSPYPGIP
jgi:hypothetical protein